VRRLEGAVYRTTTSLALRLPSTSQRVQKARKRTGIDGLQIPALSGGVVERFIAGRARLKMATSSRMPLSHACCSVASVWSHAIEIQS